MKTIVEILFGIVFLPIALVVGLLKGTIHFYVTYHRGFVEAMSK